MRFLRASSISGPQAEVVRVLTLFLSDCTGLVEDGLESGRGMSPASDHSIVVFGGRLLVTFPVLMMTERLVAPTVIGQRPGPPSSGLVGAEKAFRRDR